MSLLTKVLGVDKQILILEEKHKKQMEGVENSYLDEIVSLKESLQTDLAKEVEGWTALFKGDHELDKADREKLLEQCWNAFCKNPIVRAAVKYTTIFVFGKGITYTVEDPKAKAYVDKFYERRKLGRLQKKLSDELQSYGELFLYTPESELVENTDLSKVALEEAKEENPEAKVRVREAKEIDRTTKIPEVFDLIPVDPLEIDDIETDEYDIRKVKRYKRTYTTVSGIQVTDLIPAKEVQHISINNATNSKRGRPDLESIIRWAFRYNEFLKNRWLLNKLKRAIFFDVTVIGGPNEVRAEKAKYPHGPQFGSVVFHNESVVWKVVEPKLDARTSEGDARAFRQMIAVGVLMPEYMLSEGKGTTYAIGSVQEKVILQKFIDYQDLWEEEYVDLFRRIISLGIKHHSLPKEYEAILEDGTKEKRKMEDVPIKVHFPELKKIDLLEVAKAMTLLMDIGLSGETIYGLGGFDYAEEQKKRQKEQEDREDEAFVGGKFKE